MNYETAKEILNTMTENYKQYKQRYVERMNDFQEEIEGLEEPTEPPIEELEMVSRYQGKAQGYRYAIIDFIRAYSKESGSFLNLPEDFEF